MPMARYGEASQRVMLAADGAAQLSKPRPWKTPCGAAAGTATAGWNWMGRAERLILIVAWIARASDGSRPYDRLTSTPAAGTMSMMVWLIAASELVTAGRPPIVAGWLAARASGLD